MSRELKRQFSVEALETRWLMAFGVPIVNFNGLGNEPLQPPDTVGDVGPAHFVQAINAAGGTRIGIYNKSDGSQALPSFNLATLATDPDCANGAGDPIVVYDHLSDRWVLSEFTAPGGGDKLCVYVSQSNDPTTGQWFAYDVQAPNFPDYPKYAVWEDAYYIGTNEADNPGYALPRQRMVAGPGGTITPIRLSALDRPNWLRNHIMPVDLDGPAAPAGTPGYFIRQIDDEIVNPGGANPAADFLEIWSFASNFTVPANSTFTLTDTVPIGEFDYDICGWNRDCLPQPGTANGIDALPHYMSYRPTYRNFGTYETLVGSFTTDVATDQAGIHWFELRRTGAGPWTVYQEGTYAPDAENRWMSSIAINADGDIALGYSVTSATTFPSLRYVGRRASDPLGTLPQGEFTIIDGTGSQTFGNRWGDYSAMSVDSTDDRTFWFTSQYIPASGNWVTRIASFSFEALTPPPPPTVVVDGPRLLGVQPTPDSLLTSGVLNTLNEAPRELVLRFDAKYDIDPATLDGIKLTRTGLDGQFEFANVYSDFNTNGAVVIQFDAVNLGLGGNDLYLAVTSADRGAVSSLPGVNVIGKAIHVELNTNAAKPTTAQDVIDAVNGNATAALMVKASLRSGAAGTNVAANPINYSPLNLSSAGAATASTAFNTVTPLDVRFTATTPGQAGNNVQLNFTRNASAAAGAPPLITVSGTTVNIVLNGNVASPTTAQGLVAALNGNLAASALVTAQVMAGNGATPIGNRVINYSPLRLSGADDVEIIPAYKALGETSREVIMRFAETLPDDKYRLEVFGYDNSVHNVTALKSTNGFLFQPAKKGTDRDVIDLELDLGALVVSVVPQPVTATGATVSQSLRMVEVYLNEDDLSPASANNPAFYQLQDTTTKSILLPTSATYDAAANKVTLLFAVDLPVGTYHLHVGTSAEPNNKTDDALLIGSLFSSNAFQTRAYLGDASTGAVNDNKNDVDLYRFQLSAGATVNVTLNPSSGLNSVLRLFNSLGTQVSISNNGAAAGAADTLSFLSVTGGAYYLGVSSDANTGYDAVLGTGAAGGNSFGDYSLLVDSNATIVVDDDNSSFATATPLGLLGVAGQSLISQIEAQTGILMPPYPGGLDEPGHRDIPAEMHIGSVGTDPYAPAPIPVYPYFFPDVYGKNPQGIDLHNLITDNQKQRTREIFEIFGQLVGTHFVETTSTGLGIVTGDTLAVAPTIPPANIGGIAGMTNTGLTVALINGQTNWGQSEYGGGWFNVAMHEIGHSVGLGHAYDLPAIMGSGEAAIDPALTGEAIFPKDADVVHLQRILRPDSTDIDLYRFDVDKPGRVGAEVVAERGSVSNLDSVLRLYQQIPAVAATGFTDLQSGRTVQFRFTAAAAGHTGNRISVSFDALDLGPGALPEVNVVGDAIDVRLNTHAGSATTAQQLVTAINSVAGSLVQVTQIAGGGTDIVADASVAYLPLQLVGGANVSYEQVAQNDDYYGDDSALNIELSKGTYYVGVSSVGNNQYDPTISDTGFGGTTDGAYQLKLTFTPEVASNMVDATGVEIDGDADGVPGGGFDYWFQVANQKRVINVTAPGAGFLDTQVITLTNSSGMVRRFEFNLVGGVSGTNIPVNITSGMTSDQVATVLTTQINSAFAGMAARVGSRVTLTGERSTVLSTGLTGLVLEGKTIFVHKQGSTTPDGSTSRPFRTIASFTSPSALQVALPGDVVRIVGNGGTDANLATAADNLPYLIGFDNSNASLPDGSEFRVPKGVTVMVDAGAILKLRKANLDVGTSAQAIDRSGGALQVLGIPNLPVFFRSLRDDTIGGNSDGNGPEAAAGDWGGLVFRDDSDRFRNARNVEDTGVFLNWVNNADIKHGGGSVFVNSFETVFAPIHIQDARPTVSYNTITENSSAAISANPNAFDDSFGRLGPDIDGNTISGNSVNGLFLRINTSQGTAIDKLDVPGRFDDTDIVHVLTSVLAINGNPGGSLDGVARPAGRLAIDAGVVLKMSNARFEAERGGSQLIAEGTLYDPIVFTSLSDDRYGGGGTFDTSNNGANTTPGPGQWGGLMFNAVSQGSLDHVLIANAGGQTPIEGGFDNFNAIEVEQATFRMSNSILEDNAGGRAATNRFGRGDNQNATLFVRGAQPIVLNNIFRDNIGVTMSIDVNSLRAETQPDYGRATGLGGFVDDFDDNQGPLVRLNRLSNNEVNAMEVRGGDVTIESVWDDTDIVHVLRGEVKVLNYHTATGLRLQSNDEQSLVVKLLGGTAGITVDGTPLDINDRMGGSVQVVGSVGHPVVMTSINDCSIGAGFTPDGQAMNATVSSTCDPTGKAPYADVIVVMDESGTMFGTQVFSQQFILNLEATLAAAGIGDGTRGTNRYGLVGFGGGPGGGVDHEPGHAHPVGPGGALFGTATEYVTAAMGLVLNGGFEDGYSGIDFALDNYVFRPESAKFIILATDEDRDIYDPSLTFNTILADLSAAGVNLHGIVGATLEDGVGTPAVGIDGVGTAYLPDGLGGVILSTGGNVVFASGTTQTDYIDLINAVDPTSLTGDISSIAASPLISQSFGVALASTISNQAGSRAAAGDWRSIELNKYSNDRNLDVIPEAENANNRGGDANATPNAAQFLGQLAPNELSGDDILRLGFEIHGRISADNSADVDVYSFRGAAGTEVWLDIDKSSSSLDTIVELIDADGTLLARSQDNTTVASSGALAFPLIKDTLLGGDFFGTNRFDAGMRVVLPGNFSGEINTYFVRVRSNPTPGNIDDLQGGQTRGLYQLQARLRQIDEEPGSVVRYSDIRYATTGVDIHGLPAHSPLVSETSEAERPNNAVGQAQDLGNLLESDRNTINFGGSLADANDVDFYRFTIDYEYIQSIGGFSDGGKSWATVFDVDYADGMARPDTTFAIFDDQLRLVLVSRESNVADDQPADGQGTDFDDLSRGSVGKLDPFIGSVQMPEGTNRTFYVALSSNAQLPRALDLYYQNNATSFTTRLEPVDSIERLVEDHIGFQGYTSGVAPMTSTVLPRDTDGVFDISTSLALSAQVVPYELQDMVLYVSTAGGLVMVNPFDGSVIDVVGALAGNNTRDIAFKPDGRLYEYEVAGSNVHAGNLTLIDPGTAAESGAVGDNIRDYNAGNVDGNNNPNDPVGRVTENTVDALAFRRVDVNNYDVYYSVRVGNHTPPPNGEALRVGSSRLYQGNNTTGASNGDARGANGYIGYITGAGITGATTGMAMVGNTLYGVSEFGQFYRINQATGAATLIRNLATGYGITGFAGLSPGPKNLYDGAYANYLFAVTTGGDIVAIRAADGRPQPIFSGGSLTASTNIGFVAPVTGLALSPLDINLWHPTTRRGDVDVAGHGINPAFDNSRSPADNDVDVIGGDDTKTQNEQQGGASFYFGFEQYSDTNPSYFRYDGSNGQYGVINQNYQVDLSTNAALVNSYNLAGGALGVLESGDFSLYGYDALDRPTLYFNYWLATEGAQGTQLDQAMRDSARVSISRDGGVTWEPLATNNSIVSPPVSPPPAAPPPATEMNELPPYASHLSTAGPASNQYVQEMFDAGQWRQARVDLHQFAGEADLRLRFTFSTAGTLNQGMPGDEFGNWNNSGLATTGAVGRARNNAFEGFYIDDIMVGFAERGEMVTAAPADNASYFPVPTDPAPDAAQQQLTGTYQVEIRRGTEYATVIGGLDPDIVIDAVLDTNDRLLVGRTILAPAGSVIRDGEGFIISDGITTLNFEFDFGDGVQLGSIPVLVNAGMTDEQVAAVLRDAINAQAFGVDAYVSFQDPRVHLINAADAQPLTLLGNISVAYLDAFLDESGNTMGVVIRDGSLVGDLVVSLSALHNGNRVVLPPTVTILDGQDFATFPVIGVDDLIASGTETLVLAGLAPRYNSISGALDVTDNDVPVLSLSVAPGAVNESLGYGAATATITRNTPTDVPLTVYLTSLDRSEIEPAGAASVQITEIEPNNDVTTPQSLESVDWNLAFDANIQDLAGNDTSILAPHVSVLGSGDGTFDYYTVNGKAGQRIILDIDAANFDTELFLYDSLGNVLASNDDSGSLDNGSTSFLDSFVEFTFTSDDAYVIAIGAYNSQGNVGGLTGATPQPGDSYTLHVSVVGHALPNVVLVTIPVGASSVDVPLIAVQDFIVDGTQTATLAAFAPGIAAVTATIDVVDSAILPGLTVNISAATVVESSAAAISTTVTLSAPAPTDLVVTLLTSDSSEMAPAAATVIIPIGQTSVTFDVFARDDSVTDGDHLVELTAIAAGYASGSDTIQVTDDPADPPPTPGSTTIGLNFTGSRLNVGTSYIPPDTMGAVGPNHLVEMLNGAWRVYRKSDGANLVFTSLDQFWITAGIGGASGLFDSRVIYDTTSGRWFALSEDAASPANRIYIARSNTSDPTAGWQAVSFVITSAGGNQFNDYPTMGVDGDAMYISTNNFGSAFTISMYSIPKVDLLAATPTLANMTRFENLSAGTYGNSIQPVVDFAAADARAMMLSAPGGASLILTPINNPGAAGATLGAPVSITVPAYGAGPLGRQPGTNDNLENVSPRFTGNVFREGNSIWAAHAVAGAGSSVVRWYEINATTNALIQIGTISDPNLDFLDPSIAVNASGDVVIGMTGTGNAQFASSMAVVGSTAGGVTTFGSPLMLQAGVAEYFVDYGSGRNRWGDYSATRVDPTDPTRFWTWQEFVSATNQWAIQITEIQVGNQQLDLTTSIIGATSVAENAGNSASTVRISRPTNAGPLTVNLTSSDASELTLNGTGTASISVTIPNGAFFVDVPLDAVDDRLTDGTQTVVLTASASGFNSVVDTIDVNDSVDDASATLSLSLLGPSVVDEFFPFTTQVQVTRSNTDGVLNGTLLISDGSEAAAIPANFTIANGANSAVVTVESLDDFLNDDLQIVVLSATNAGTGTDLRTYASLNQLLGITDDDSPNFLTMTLGDAFVFEDAGAAATTGTLDLLIPLDYDLVVTLVSSDPSEATVAPTIVIPAGATQVTFDIDAIDEIGDDGVRTTNIVALARGFFSASQLLDVIGVAGAGTVGVDAYARLGDKNLERQQGQVVIESNVISRTSVAGISVDAGAREAGTNMPFPGSAINVPTLNTERLAPGATISNNLIYNFGRTGILISGDPNTPVAGAVPLAVVPFARVINNTVYGSESTSGTGIQVTNNASPTLLNNLIANTVLGIDIDPTSVASTIVGTTLFSANTSDGTVGNNAIQLALGAPLFIDPLTGNFYLQDGSLAIDASLNSLSDRFGYIAVKSPLGLPPSDVVAPSHDVYGQLRQDDPTQDPYPGLGLNIFKDRGAVDRVDVTGPYGGLLNPADNEVLGIDLDPTPTVVQLQSGIYSSFDLVLSDGAGLYRPFDGTGIDVGTLAIDAISISRDGKVLTNGIDYEFGYQVGSDTLRITPLAGIWKPSSTYVITLNNQDRFILTAPEGYLGVDGTKIEVTDGFNSTVTYEYETGYNITVPQTLTLQVPTVGAGPGGVADGEQFSITDGTLTVVFEFDRNSNVNLGSIPIVIGTNDNQDEVAQALVAAIAGSGLGLSPRNLGFGAVHLGSLANHVVDLTGSVLTQTGVAAGVEDGQTFTYTHLTTTVTFELEDLAVGDGVAPGNVAIGFRHSQTNEEIGQSIAAALQTAGLGLDQAEHLFSGLVHLGGAAGDLLDTTNAPPLAVTGAPGVSSGYQLIVPLAGAGPSGITDGETFTITDGTTTVQFEFDSDNTITAGNTKISFSPFDTQDMLAAAVVNVVGNAGLGLAPAYLGNGVVSLNESTKHKVDVSMSPNLMLVGVAGGAVPITFDATFTANQVAALLVAAINQSVVNGTLQDVEVKIRSGSTIFLDQAVAVTGIENELLSAIKDLAGNPLQPNQPDGETRFTIIMPSAVLDYGDAPDPRFNTLRENNGARHVVYLDDQIYLGAAVDTEANGQQSTNSDGDGADEDGVTFGGPLGIPFNPNTLDTPITILAHGTGFLDAWIDWNGNGSFNDAGEQVFKNFTLIDGVNDQYDGLIIHTPPGAAIGNVAARFRFSPTGGLLPDGITVGGEVEDYQITILPGQPPVAVTDSYSVDEDNVLSKPTKAEGVLGNDTDVDPVTDPVIALLVRGPAHAAVGGFTLNTNGSFTYTPLANYYGSDSFVYRAKDSTGLVSNEEITVAITVNPVNDAPVNAFPAVQTTNEDTPLTLSSTTLPLANGISVADDAGVNPIQVTLTAPNGTISLSGISGLSFSFSDANGTGAGDGAADSTMTFRGTPTDVNAALEGLVFLPTLDFNGPTTLVISTNDLGNTGGGALTDTDTLAINVTAVNDAPVTTAPTMVVTNEDIPMVFTGVSLISIADDSLAAPIQVTLTATNGLMTLSGTSGLNFAFSDGFGTGSGTGTDNSTMTFRGSLTDINAALNNLTFKAPQDFNGTGTIVVGVNDLGNLGLGTALTDLDTITIGVAAVNDPPVNTVPGSQTVLEDTTLTFSSALGRQISVADLEAGSNSIQVTLTAVNGAVSLNGVAGLGFSVGDGSADPTMTFTGTIATINTRLNGLTFRPNINFAGEAHLIIATNDLGFIGSGGPQVDTDTITITVTPVNDAPVNQVPGAQTMPEDLMGGLVFSTGNGNAVSVSDDAGASQIQVKLTAVNGTMTLSGTSGLNFTFPMDANGTGTGDGTADTTMTFRGTMANINAALAGLTFVPPTDFSGTATMAIVTNDLGSTGAGTVQTDTDTVTITVTAVNDPPVNSIPGTQVTDDEVPVVFSSGNSNRITISDVDAGSGQVRVSLTGIDGQITLPSVSGLTFTVGDGVSDANMSFSGTIANINLAMNGLSFRPNDFFNGTAHLVVTTNDNGLTGAGGQQIDTDTVTITVNSVNDPPVNTIPGLQTVDEDTALFFGTATNNAISVIDDALTLSIEVQLTASNGLMTLANTNGLTFIGAGDGTDDSTMTVRGTYTDISAALNDLKFQPNGDYNGPASIVMRTDDLGNAPIGSTPLVVTSTVAITVTAINDAPVNTVPGSKAMLEDTLLTLGGADKISVADVDATQLQVTLTVVGGVVNLNGTAGLTFTAGDGLTDALVTFRGTPGAVNTALDGLTFSPANGSSGPATITVLSSDLGGTGVGGILTDTDVVSITVTPVNDPPTHTLPATPSVAEDSTLTLSGAGAVVVVDDAGTNVVRMTITSTNGTVALGSTGGLVFNLGDGSATAAMAFTGTLTDINTALNGLLFRPTTDFVGSATIVFSTEDFGNTGGGPSLTGTDTLTISVTGVNDAPVNTVPASQSTPEDVALVFSSGLANQISVADIDAGSNAVRVSLNATSGNVTLSTITDLAFSVGDGATDASMTFTGTLAAVNAALNGLTFRSATDYFGPAGLQIVTNDLGNTGAGAALGDTDTITITVTAVNDPPVASPIPRGTSEDTPLTISATSLTANDVPGPSNESGQVPLTLATGTTPSAQGGTVTIASGQVVYTPALNFNGTDTFTYLITDNGLTNGVAEPKSAFGTVTVTVQPVNDAPTAVNDLYVMNEDTTLVRSALTGVLANDTDPEGTSLTATRISGPTVGTLSLAADGSFTYIPPANFFGNATFTYRASDAALNSNIATVTITVQDVNEPPVANGDSASTTKNVPVMIDVLTNDSDVDGTLNVATVQIVSAAIHGTATPNPNGTITYTPNSTYEGSDTFQYTVRDNAGDVSNVAIVSVTIGPAPPIWQNQLNNLDVNADGFISPIDALLIINKLNLDGPGTLPVPAPIPPPPFYDVNGDGSIAPNDALLVVNHLNLNGGGEGEGPDVADAAPMTAYYGPLLIGSNTIAARLMPAALEQASTNGATDAVFADATLPAAQSGSLLATNVDEALDSLAYNDLGDHDSIDDALLELWGE